MTCCHCKQELAPGEPHACPAIAHAVCGCGATSMIRGEAVREPWRCIFCDALNPPARPRRNPKPALAADFGVAWLAATVGMVCFVAGMFYAWWIGSQIGR